MRKTLRIHVHRTLRPVRFPSLLQWNPNTNNCYQGSEHTRENLQNTMYCNPPLRCLLIELLRLDPPHALLSALDFVSNLGLRSLAFSAGELSIVDFGFLDLGSAFVLAPLPRREEPVGTLNVESSSATNLLPLSPYVPFTVMLEH